MYVRHRLWNAIMTWIVSIPASGIILPPIAAPVTQQFHGLPGGQTRRDLPQ
jgi:hypothetical protein